jgi:hypothetical protein
MCGAMYYYAAMVTGWQRHSALKMPQYEKKNVSAINEKEGQ